MSSETPIASFSLQHTPFYHNHVSASGKLVDFAGWALPIHYGSQVTEHHHVRQNQGMFDVSHMMITDCEGEGASAYLRYLLANDVAKLVDGKALYSCLLKPDAGIIDDLIVYRLSQTQYRIISNAGTRDKVRVWLREQAAQYDVTLRERHDLAILAIQGPNAIETVAKTLVPDVADSLRALRPFHILLFNDIMIARTGYTGEAGVEILLPAEIADTFWQRALAAGIPPCGLGARDTLRLEAGMNLYGADMTESVTPLESGLAWTVAFEPNDRDFIGREALLSQKAAGVPTHLIGLVLTTRGVMREHQKIYVGSHEIGEISSGGFSPTLEKSIALARVSVPVSGICEVDIRGKRLPVTVVQYPFVRAGNPVYQSINVARHNNE